MLAPASASRWSSPKRTAATTACLPIPIWARTWRSDLTREAHGRGGLDAVKAAGYSNAQLVEIIVHVSLNTLTNYINDALKTEIDFPVVAHHAR